MRIGLFRLAWALDPSVTDMVQLSHIRNQYQTSASFLSCFNLHVVGQYELFWELYGLSINFEFAQMHNIHDKYGTLCLYHIIFCNGSSTTGGGGGGAFISNQYNHALRGHIYGCSFHKLFLCDTYTHIDAISLKTLSICFNKRKETCFHNNLKPKMAANMAISSWENY